MRNKYCTDTSGGHFPMKLIPVLAGILLLMLCQSQTSETAPPFAIRGELNLDQWDIGGNREIPIRGEWEFYWNQLLIQSDFQGTTAPVTPDYIQVPGTWNSHIINRQEIGSSGFATYRLRLHLKNPGQALAFKPGSILTAYRFYVNGQLLSQRGTVGSSAESSVPMLLNDTIIYNGLEDNLELIIHVSNFHHRLGGPWDRMELGTLSYIAACDQTARDTDFFILGALIIMGIFYLSMYLSRKQDSAYLYFALFCLIIALRMSLQSGVGYIYQLLPNMPWEITNKLEYLTMYLALPFFMLFMISFFHEKLLLWAFRFVLVTSAACAIVTLASTSITHSWLIPAYQIILLGAGGIILAVIIRNSCKKNRFAIILLVAFLLLFGTVVNDILYSNGYLASFFMISYGLLLFIMFQAYVLTVRFIEVFNSVDRQKRQLTKTNREFIQEIEKRVKIERDLKDSNENLVLAKSAIILGLAKIAEYRDSDTGSHLSRIQEFNRLLAVELAKHPDYQGYISSDYISDLYQSSILHDIGKVGISDTILLKPGKLTPEEFEIIKKHPTIGGDTIRSIEKNIHAQTFLTLGREIAYMHHEKWDGTGYPLGLSGKNISLSARITALSDVYDALTTKRCYKEAFPHAQAVQIISSDRGKQFDPDIVDAFLKVHEDFASLRAKLQDLENKSEEESLK